MAIWFRDHLLPGLTVTALVWLSHQHLWRKIRKLTAEQTRAIRGDEEEGGPC